MLFFGDLKFVQWYLLTNHMHGHKVAIVILILANVNATMKIIFQKIKFRLFMKFLCDKNLELNSTLIKHALLTKLSNGTVTTSPDTQSSHLLEGWITESPLYHSCSVSQAVVMFGNYVFCYIVLWLVCLHGNSVLLITQSPRSATDNFLAVCEPVIKSRRVMIPPKPNHKLNLWSIMKNSIGKDLSKIPLPVSCYCNHVIQCCVIMWSITL